MLAKIIIDNVKESEVPLILDRLKSIDNAWFKINYSQASQAIEKRLKMIMSLVDEYARNGKEHTLETYFRVMRTRGYAMNRKTFTRDITLLENMRKIKRQVITGGAKGTTSIITKASP